MPVALMTMYEMDRAWPLSLYTHPASLITVGVGAGGLVLAALTLEFGIGRSEHVFRSGLMLGALFGCIAGAVAAAGALLFQLTSDSYIPGIVLGHRMGGLFFIARFLPLVAGTICAFVLYRGRYRHAFENRLRAS